MDYLKLQIRVGKWTLKGTIPNSDHIGLRHQATGDGDVMIEASYGRGSRSVAREEQVLPKVWQQQQMGGRNVVHQSRAGLWVTREHLGNAYIL
jgi:hypothetical protein